MTDFVATARKALEDMTKGEFDAVPAIFSAELAQSLTAETLKAQWAQIIAQVGDFKEVVDAQHAQADGVDVAALLLQFEHARLALRFAFKDGRAIGMHITPVGAAEQK